MGSRTQGNWGGSGKESTRKLWLIEKSRKKKHDDNTAILTSMAFTQRSEVEDYLSHPLIECLICAHKAKSLGSHVKVHGLTAKEYKEALGLPVQRGLCTKEYSKSQAVITKQLHKDGILTTEKLITHSMKSKKGKSYNRPKYWENEQKEKAVLGQVARGETVRGKDGRYTGEPLITNEWS